MFLLTIPTASNCSLLANVKNSMAISASKARRYIKNHFWLFFSFIRKVRTIST